VFFGTIVSLGLTLYVVPALYLLIARNTRSPEYMTRLIEGLKGRREGARGAATAAGASSSEAP
jgi:multidrug efflux pump